jgi:guanylate kinase
MAQARDELSHFDEYDFLIVNDRFETALSELAAVVTAERLRLNRQRRHHAAMLAELLETRGD